MCPGRNELDSQLEFSRLDELIDDEQNGIMRDAHVGRKADGMDDRSKRSLTLRPFRPAEKCEGNAKDNAIILDSA